jgi:hypothetical protein
MSFRDDFKTAIENTNRMYEEDGRYSAIWFHETGNVDMVVFIDLTDGTNIRSYAFDEIEDIEDEYLEHYKEELKEYETISILTVPETVFDSHFE